MRGNHPEHRVGQERGEPRRRERSCACTGGGPRGELTSRDRSHPRRALRRVHERQSIGVRMRVFTPNEVATGTERDRKSTRLNSSHLVISYAVFCLKKKNRF